MDVKNSGAMVCPRCGGAVAVGSSVVLPGLLWLIISALMTTYTCPKCGQIPFSEFPQQMRDQERSKMWWTILGSLGAMVLIVVVIVVVIMLTQPGR